MRGSRPRNLHAGYAMPFVQMGSQERIGNREGGGRAAGEPEASFCAPGYSLWQRAVLAQDKTRNPLILL